MTKGFIVAGPTSGKTTVTTSGDKVGAQFWDADCLWKVLFPFAKEKKIASFSPAARQVINQLKGIAETLAAAVVAERGAVPLLSFRVREASELLPKGTSLLVGRTAEDMADTSHARGDDMPLPFCKEVERMGRMTAERLSVPYTTLKADEYLASILFGKDFQVPVGDHGAQHEKDARLLRDAVKAASEAAAEAVEASAARARGKEPDYGPVDLVYTTPNGDKVVLKSAISMAEAVQQRSMLSPDHRKSVRIVKHAVKMGRD